VIRLSIDTKATIKIGPYSRGGYNRHGACGADHDFAPEAIIKLFGIFIPQIDESHFYFTTSNVTADFMVDALHNLWPRIKKLVDPHTIVINADNGPENSSRRTQFIKRIVEFAQSKKIDVCLAYYPPYHSKYNPVERVWGILEKHWNGQLLDSIDKVIGLAKTMKWKGNNPFVQIIDGIYNTGVRLTQGAMNKYEKMLKRKTGLEKWFVDILCYNQ